MKIFYEWDGQVLEVECDLLIRNTDLQNYDYILDAMQKHNKYWDDKVSSMWIEENDIVDRIHHFYD